MKSLNLGILAHVDAGKTSLTERLLFESGVISALGSVDKGSTRTDSLELERQRGITIKSAVVSFRVGDLKINLIDTPGHPDFIAEVERALSVLDAVVLVVSAVEGVQPQTRVLMRTLKKLRIPTLLFVNKIDRMDARELELVADIKTKLFSDVVVMDSVERIGSRDAVVVAVEQARVDRARVAAMQTCPVFFGSALTGVGVRELTQGFEKYLAPSRNDSALLSAVVFKIERGQRGEKIAYMRMYSGELHTRSQLELQRTDTNGAAVSVAAKVTGMQLFQDGETVEAHTAKAGDIVKVWGLGECLIGDYVGELPAGKLSAQFARPSLEAVVVSDKTEDRAKLHQALMMLSEQDPLIQVRQNEQGVLSVRLYGEVQREVIKTMLHDEHGISVSFEKTQTIYIEKPRGVGEAFASRHDKDNFFMATLGFRIELGNPGGGVVFRPGVGVGSLPVAFLKAVEDTVHRTLQQGLYGWEVTDCIVALTHVGYDAVLSTGGDFRNLTPLLVMEALQKAGTAIFEPLNHFELDTPATTLAVVLQSLSAAEARIDHMPASQHDVVRIEGVIPVRRVVDFERNVPDLTGGEGMFTAEFGGYAKVTGAPPMRERTDNNPLNREEYLRRTLKRS